MAWQKKGSAVRGDDEKMNLRPVLSFRGKLENGASREMGAEQITGMDKILHVHILTQNCSYEHAVDKGQMSFSMSDPDKIF